MTKPVAFTLQDLEILGFGWDMEKGAKGKELINSAHSLFTISLTLRILNWNYFRFLRMSLENRFTPDMGQFGNGSDGSRELSRTWNSEGF